MTRFSFLAAVAAMALAGCAPDERYVISVDSRCSVEQLAVVDDAAREWSEATGVRLLVVLGDVGYDESVIRISSVADSDRWYGRTERHDESDSARTVIGASFWRRDIVAHELGHAIGIASHQPCGIMHPVDPTDEVRHVDVCDALAYERSR